MMPDDDDGGRAAAMLPSDAADGERMMRLLTGTRKDERRKY
jgi:hypothetical protein